MTKKQQQERIALRLQYATGEKVNVTNAVTVKNEQNEPAKVKVTAKASEAIQVDENALYTIWEKDGSRFCKAKGSLYNW